MENESDQWRAQDEVKKIEAFTTSELQVEIDHSAWNDIFGWCRAADSEVSGLGLVKKEGSKFTIYKAFILPQTCTAVGTTLKEEGKALLMRDLAKKKIPQSDLKLWWHTHYNFGTFWSGTDVETALRLSGFNSSWMLSMVINQAGDYKCRLDLVEPVRVGIEGLSVAVKYPEGQAQDKYKADVAKYVEEEAPTITHTPWVGYGPHGSEEKLVPAWPAARKLSNKERRRLGLPRLSNGVKTRYHFLPGRGVVTEDEYMKALADQDSGGMSND